MEIQGGGGKLWLGKEVSKPFLPPDYEEKGLGPESEFEVWALGDDGCEAVGGGVMMLVSRLVLKSSLVTLESHGTARRFRPQGRSPTSAGRATSGASHSKGRGDSSSNNRHSNCSRRTSGCTTSGNPEGEA